MPQKFMNVIPRCMGAIRTEMRAAAQERLDGVSVVQFRVLAGLWQKPMNNRELAEHIGIGVPATSRLVDGLVKRGSVQRKVSEHDRRQVYIELTPAGSACFETLSSVAGGKIAQRFESLSEEKRTKLLAGLEVLGEVMLSGVLALCIGFAAFGSSRRAYAEDKTPITLREAVERALAKNPTVLKAREHVQEVDAVSRTAISQLFPTISGTLLAQHRKDTLNSAAPLFDGTPYNLYNFGFILNQPLLQGGALWASVKGAKKDRDISHIDLEIAERDMTQQVLVSFYGIVLAQEKLESLENSEKVERESVDEAKRRNKVGRSSPLDVLQARTQLALLTPQLATARNQRRIAATQLATLIGLAGARELHIKGSLRTPDWNGIQKRLGDSKARRLEIEKIDRQLDRFDDSRTIALAKHWPTVALVGTYNRQAFVKNDLFDPDSAAWSFSLQATIPLFSGLSSVQERSVLLSLERQLEDDKMRTSDIVALDKVTAQQQLDVAIETISSSKQALDLANESLTEARREYRLGTIDYQQLLGNQQSQLAADISCAQSRYDYLQNLAHYYVAFGYDLGRLVQEMGESVP